jgi:mono/diheme cytochrome c family protein
MIHSSALGADAEAGKRLARQRCAVCHIVEPNQRHEVAKAPPFDAISRKFGANSHMLVFDMIGPHSKTHLRLRHRDAVNVAEYIRTLVNGNDTE